MDHIEVILFDMGGTLRANVPRDEIAKIEIVKQIPDMLRSNKPASEFTRLLTIRERQYEDWASENLVELNEEDLWTKWMLPELPAEKISGHAMQLNSIWREAICERVVFEDTVPTIRRLFQNGYRIGLVSNTTSSIDSPRTLEKAGIANCFEVVVLSCVFGKRKPDPKILLEAARRMKILPEKCAYIGDRPEWDVVAARQAGFGRTVILRNQRYTSFPSISRDQTPDHYIDNLRQLLDIFSR